MTQQRAEKLLHALERGEGRRLNDDDAEKFLRWVIAAEKTATLIRDAEKGKKVVRRTGRDAYTFVDT